MRVEDQCARGMQSLELLLGFFDRVDTKLSVVLGINIGLVGLLAAQFHDYRQVAIVGWSAIGVFLICALTSLYHLYRGSFPHTDGGRGSLLYFKEIAKRTSAEFCGEFAAQDAEARLRDVLEQTWQNAVILSEKYRHLRCAYQAMALSLVPWAVGLGALTAFK